MSRFPRKHVEGSGFVSGSPELVARVGELKAENHFLPLMQQTPWFLALLIRHVYRPRPVGIYVTNVPRQDRN